MFAYILFALLIFSLGMAVGAGALVTIHLRHKAGTMNVYIPKYSDEDPYVCPEFTRGADFVCRQKYVWFDVKVNSLNSQK